MQIIHFDPTIMIVQCRPLFTRMALEATTSVVLGLDRGYITLYSYTNTNKLEKTILFFSLHIIPGQVFFESDEVHACIVTCGGLCPGLNTVIREIVCGLYDMYGVSRVLGIQASHCTASQSPYTVCRRSYFLLVLKITLFLKYHSCHFGLLYIFPVASTNSGRCITPVFAFAFGNEFLLKRMYEQWAICFAQISILNITS